MFIVVENNCLKAWANYKFSETAIEVSANENCSFENGYQIQNGEVIQVGPNKSYAELRFEAYPSIAEQLDMIYWDKVNGTNLWQQKIAEIKARYPKG